MTDGRGKEKEAAAETGGSGNPDVLATWEIKFRVAFSRFFIWDILKFMIIGFVILVPLFSVAAIIQEATDIIGKALLFMVPIFIGFGLVMLLTSAVMYAGGYPAAFALTNGGILWASRSQRDKTASRLAILLGVLERNPSLAAAGFIAASQETGGISWDRIRRVKIYPKPRAITIKNSWRVVIRVYAKPENFDSVTAIIRERATDAVIKTIS